MAIIPKARSFSSHWYHKDGTPQHRMQAQDGSFRGTHLGDARKFRLLPSVTAILGVLDKPGLDRWKINQAILACLRTARQEGETDKFYCDRVADAAYQQVDDAADLGTAIHGEIDRFLRHDGKTPFVPGEVTINDRVYQLGPYVKPVIDWMIAKQIRVIDPEKVVVSLEHGFAGTSDAPYESPKSFGILDYKSRKTEPGKEIEHWPEQVLQIAAYFVGYWGEAALLKPNAWGGNIYISTTEPGRIRAILYPPQMLRAAWVAFTQVCALWRHFNEYDPRGDASQHVAWAQPVVVDIARPDELPMDNAPQDKKPSQTPLPAPTILDLLNQAKQENVCDGIEFLSPQVCAGFTPGKVKSIYAWWYHQETNTARVGLFADAAMQAHGWQNAFFAYPKNLDHVNRTEGKADPATGTNGLPVKPAPKSETKPEAKPAAPATDKAKDRARLKELESCLMGFGKFRESKLKDVPSSYLDWLRGQVDKKDNKIPAYVKEYLARPDVNKSIDQDLERSERK